MFRVEIETSNAVFDDDDQARIEIAHLLDGLSNKLTTGVNEGILKDTNGNTVGKWSYTSDQ